MTQKWYQSKAAWIAIAALLGFVVKNWVGWEIPQFDTFIDLLLVAAAAVGIFNNPTSKNSFS
jgi:hypothetical protein